MRVLGVKLTFRYKSYTFGQRNLSTTTTRNFVRIIIIYKKVVKLKIVYYCDLWELLKVNDLMIWLKLWGTFSISVFFTLCKRKRKKKQQKGNINFNHTLLPELLGVKNNIASVRWESSSVPMMNHLGVWIWWSNLLSL